MKEADFIVMNTCVVRQNAEDRAVNKLQNFKPLKKARPEIIIAVTGCWVDSNIDRLKADFPMSTIFLKPANARRGWTGKNGRRLYPKSRRPPPMCRLFKGVIISAPIASCLTAAAGKKAVPFRNYL